MSLNPFVDTPWRGLKNVHGPSGPPRGGLVGFVGFILSNTGWLYALGALFTAIGYYRLAPTAAHLARDQDDMSAAGCRRSLVNALAGPAPIEP
jgi:hypothetical protein